MLTDRINRISPSATLAMTAKAAELRAKGLDVINLSVGEPDFPTPKNIQNAGMEAITTGITRYTPGPGMMPLREAVCEKLQRDNSLSFSPDEIIVSCGGKHSLYNACMALFQTGDEVIIFSPYWVSFPDFISVTGATPVVVKTDPKQQFEPVISDLNSKINSKTKGIIINSPSNPTGGVWGDDAIREVLSIANENDLWVFSDECYEQLTYENPFTSFANFTENDEKILTFQSCSKTYAMTGWRIGYTAGHKQVIKAMSKLQGQSTSCPNSIAQFAAIEALTGDQSAVAEMRDAFRVRRDYIVDRLNSIDGVQCEMPYGAFYVFPDISAYFGKSFENNKITTPDDMSMFILDKTSVVSVPGESFGSQKNIRFSYAASNDDLKKAMDRLENTLRLLA
ncbi:MAG: pyridoxal phosphate-dependent aminotransferase [Candidatus Marinimicrobia bacterium]|jgi:aspartate aminotransferase|nr:pyridoxal phosphate-dependent aminotransferase [Candidatus Neomarinimicrobiota bacterium]MBT3683698.1 pyridoxal phosphate-dependent aminotransferase [Candidatus Neomarinimicrobiota bacterium]MBT3760697.1 pyridoxal phosphate-dependent aminotransferase [Candidatus Neomarinimicrobiota bacterium]MBT3896745.1 pyridoxal phosphate-dependent aminotransferase [Candidatus Neomarinimicrobiota bacterium]MBT4173803.1 pyridoxal phosphate-dependent aminotransferase [Candidatus Neomarinimicrobiota bacterium